MADRYGFVSTPAMLHEQESPPSHGPRRSTVAVNQPAPSIRFHLLIGFWGRGPVRSERPRPRVGGLRPMESLYTIAMHCHRLETLREQGLSCPH
jgi:hypothetical protein